MRTAYKRARAKTGRGANAKRRTRKGAKPASLKRAPARAPPGRAKTPDVVNGRHARQKQESALTRERILDAATHVFVAAGYEGASTNDILKRCGGSKATLFKHFPTKEALFAGVVRRACARLMEGPSCAGARDEPRPFLRAFGRRIVASLLTKDRLFATRIMISEARRFPSLSGAVFQAGPARMLGALEAEIARWRDEGLVRSTDPSGDARRFLGMVIGAAVTPTLLAARKPPSIEAIGAMTDSAVEIFLYGVAREPKRRAKR